MASTAFAGPKPTPLMPASQELSLKFVAFHVEGVETTGIRTRTAEFERMTLLLVVKTPTP